MKIVWIVKRLSGQKVPKRQILLFGLYHKCALFWSETSGQRFRAAQMDDTLLGEVYGLLRDNPMSALTISSDMKRLLDENLYISLNGILCRTSLEGRSQIVVPSVLIPEVL